MDFDGDGKRDMFDDTIGYELIFGSESESDEKNCQNDEEDKR